MYNNYKVITKEGKHFKIVFLEDTYSYGIKFSKGSWIKIRRIDSFNEHCSLYEFKTNETRNFYHYKKSKKVRIVIEEDYVNLILTKRTDLYNCKLLNLIMEKKDKLTYKKNVVASSLNIGYHSNQSDFFIDNKNNFIVPNLDMKFWNPLITSIGKNYYILENRSYQHDIYLIKENMLLSKEDKITYSRNIFTKDEKKYLTSTSFININYEFELLKDNRTLVCKVYKDKELVKTLEAKLSQKLKEPFKYSINFNNASISEESFINLKNDRINKIFYLNEKENIFNYIGSYKSISFKVNNINYQNNEKEFYFCNKQSDCLNTPSHTFYKGKEYLSLPISLIVSKHNKYKSSSKVLSKFSIRLRPKDHTILFNNKEYNSLILKEFNIIKKCKSVKAICDCENAKLVVCYSFDKNHSIYETIDLVTKKIICLSETNFPFIQRGSDDEFSNNFYKHNDINKITNLKKELIKIKLNGDITNE